MDGDGNGLMTDAAGSPLDRPQPRRPLGPVLRAVLFATIFNLDGCAATSLRSDQLGSRLAVEPLSRHGGPDGAALRSGKEEPPTCTPDPGRPRRLGLRPLRQRAGDRPGRRVPAGHGHGAFDDPQGGQSWSFIFSDNGARGDPRWYKVGKDSRSRSTRSGRPVRDRAERQGRNGSSRPARTFRRSPCSTRATGS